MAKTEGGAFLQNIFDRQNRANDAIMRAISGVDGMGIRALNKDELAIGLPGKNEQVLLSRTANGDVVIQTQNPIIFEASTVADLAGAQINDDKSITIPKKSVSDLADALMHAGESKLVHPANRAALESFLVDGKSAEEAMSKAVLRNTSGENIVLSKHTSALLSSTPESGHRR